MGRAGRPGRASRLHRVVRRPDVDAGDAADVFGTAPRELTRSITLRQTLDLVRSVVDGRGTDDRPRRAGRGAGAARVGAAVLAGDRLRRGRGLRARRRGPRRLGRPARGAWSSTPCCGRGGRLHAVPGRRPGLGHDHAGRRASRAARRTAAPLAWSTPAPGSRAVGVDALAASRDGASSASSATSTTPPARRARSADHFGDGRSSSGPDGAATCSPRARSRAGRPVPGSRLRPRWPRGAPPGRGRRPAGRAGPGG